jgi:hypothetical protein
MFYYNVKFHFKLKPGSPPGSGGIILATAMPSLQLVRRDLFKYPHLQHRLFDPQLYLSKIDPAKAAASVRKLATYPWFGKSDIPPYDSEAHGTQRQYKEQYGDSLAQSWRRSPPTDPAGIADAARAAVELQLSLGCEGIILPGPMTDNPRRGYQDEAQWIDVGLEVCRDLRVSLPIYATIAITDSVLRGAEALRDALLDQASGHVASRENLAGAYIVIEQASEEGVCCASTDTLLSLMILVDDIVRGAGKQAIVNYAGGFGAVTTAAGASIWATGYYPSQRRLRLVDLDDRDFSAAYPRYFSAHLAGDIGIKGDLLRVSQRGLRDRAFLRTKAARRLHEALGRGEPAESLVEWNYIQGNHDAAMPHYYESVYRLGKHLHSLGREERVDWMHDFLRNALGLARDMAGIKPKLSSKTDLSHQQTWLSVYETWRSYAGL